MEFDSVLACFSLQFCRVTQALQLSFKHAFLRVDITLFYVLLLIEMGDQTRYELKQGEVEGA